jgi:hypothetical protein
MILATRTAPYSQSWALIAPILGLPVVSTLEAVDRCSIETMRRPREMLPRTYEVGFGNPHAPGRLAEEMRLEVPRLQMETPGGRSLRAFLFLRKW